MKMDVLIIGAGGHGKVVLDILRAAGEVNPVGFIDADASLAGTTVAGVEVIGGPNLLPKLRKKYEYAIVAIGDNRARRRYASAARDTEFELINAIHPSASVSTSATLGKNVVIAAGAVVCTEAEIADSVIVNTSAVVDHECVIADAAHIAPGALLAGRVRIGEEAFVGLGAKIIQCLTVGDHATVGAGAVAIEDVPPQVTVVGVPARLIKATNAVLS
jgi:UDP-perosamine 4-acetyltransferase